MDSTLFPPDTFPANYFDRARGEACAAEVRVQPGFLSVFLKKLPAGQTLEWTLADLTSAREHADGSVILQNGRQFLEIHAPGFRAAFERSFPKNRLFRQQGFFDKIGAMGCLAAILLVLLPLLGSYFWVLPGLADRAAGRISPDMERKIGDSWFAALTANQNVDTARTRLVQQFYDSLGFGGDYQIRVTVVNEPVINAYAVPGGQIVVFDSILRLMDAPEQLAGLLAHEVSHVHLKHSTRAIFRELGNSLFFSLLLGDLGEVSGIVAQQADQLAGLSYSRELEFEADDNGLKLLEKSRIPPQGMPTLFRKMEAALAESGADGPPTFLSTHPSMGERVRVAEEKIGQMNTQNFEVSAGLQAIFDDL